MSEKVDQIKALRNKTGLGLIDCKRALDKCNYDSLLAEGWLRYYGCAIHIEDGYDEWVMKSAKRWAKDNG